MKAEEAIQQLQAYRLRMKLNKVGLAKIMGVPKGTVSHWLAGRGPSEEGVRIIERFLSNLPSTLEFESNVQTTNEKKGRNETERKRNGFRHDTPERVARLRNLFLLIAQDLEALRAAGEADRELYRNTLDNRDIGYLSSLMAMLCDENQFQRWMQFSTYRFRQFKQSEDV